MARSSAEILAALAEPGSFTSWDLPRRDDGLPDEYVAELRAAEQASGVDEAVITGEGVVGGFRVALIVSEFGFIGGSLGAQTVARVVRAVERATERGLPVVGAVASGGTRMQEGTAAFVCMTDIAGAFMRHRASLLPSVIFLCHRVFGGALATWGSLATITIAEENAAIGLLGPRIYRTVVGEALPPGTQRARHLAELGLVDELAPFEEFRGRAAAALDLLCGPDFASAPPAMPVSPAEATATGEVADPLERSRRPGRAGVRELIARLPQPVLWLRGSASVKNGPTVLCIARIGGVRALIVAQDRAAEDSHYGVADLRLAQEGIHLAQWLGLPIVTVVDTPGTELSVAAEEGGLARQISITLGAMAARTVPAVTLLLGEGCGAAAISIFGGDVVVAAEGSWLAALPLEGAADILYGDGTRAVQAAVTQRVGAPELLADGIIDRIVAEPEDDDPVVFADAMIAACAEELARLVPVTRAAPSADSGQAWPPGVPPRRAGGPVHIRNVHCRCANVVDARCTR